MKGGRPVSRLPPVGWDEHEIGTFRRAAWTLRGRPGAAGDRTALDRAVGDLLDALGTALTADHNAVPPTVQRAALRAARLVETTRRPAGVRGAGPDAAGGPAGRETAPFASSIRLGRMG
jgi:hypothetical protein